MFLAAYNTQAEQTHQQTLRTHLLWQKDSVCIVREIVVYTQRGLYYKTYYSHNLQIFHSKLECLSVASFLSLV
jgi:hypothetical protein